MRLLFLNYEFPPLGGGAGFASLALARQLVALGHRVDFLTAATAHASAAEEIDGVRVHRVACFRRGVHDSGIAGALSFVCSAALRLPGIARRGEYDAYHYYFGLPTGLLSRLPGPHAERPYVVSLRGSDVPGYDPSLTRWHRALLPVTRRIWGGAHRVVANSDGLRQLARAAVPTQAIDVILNGVEFRATPQSAAPRGSLRVLTVSRLIERKGLDTLIEAVAACDGATLEIAGEGPCRAALESLARKRGIQKRVHFHGFVDRDGLAALHAGADVFALTSRAESCSMALLESMGAGLPVIATRVGGTPELVDHDRNGLLVEADDVAALSTALRTLRDEPQRRARYAAANRTLVQSRFTWRAVAERYEAVFEDAVEHSRHRAHDAAVPTLRRSDALEP